MRLISKKICALCKGDCPKLARVNKSGYGCSNCKNYQSNAQPS